MDPQEVKIWKILLVVSTLVFFISLISLPNLYENISGDSIPNRPQKEPPIVYRWDLALTRIIIAIISLIVGIYSLKKLRLNQRALI